MELTAKYGEYTISYKSHAKTFMAQDTEGDVIRDGFTDLDKLTESLDNLDKRAESGKKKSIKIAVLHASGSGYCEPVTATSIAETGWRKELKVWVVDNNGKRGKEMASVIILDTPENRKSLKQLKDKYNAEATSAQERGYLYYIWG